MVAIPKKNGKLCICVDLKHSYEAVVKEVYLLLKVDEPLAQTSGATIFSTLDTNSDFLVNPTQGRVPSTNYLYYAIWTVLV